MPTATRSRSRSKTRTRPYRPKRRPVATVQETTTSLRKYDEKWLTCRDLKHAWKIIGVYRDHEGDRCRVLVCERGCEVAGFDTLGVSGERVKPRRYKYPTGYKIGKLDPVDVRAEQIRRTKVYRSEAEMMANAFNGNGRKR